MNESNIFLPTPLSVKERILEHVTHTDHSDSLQLTNTTIITTGLS